ncbi:ATP-dependent helicase [Candidatus Marsarchaeota archaeon]|nr:ATP-dependent helicase [Candidatus Marsarchaeota archaeon]
MIKFYEKPFSKEESLSSLSPEVRSWFEETHKELTPPQYYSFKLISEGNNILITAPTGSGKTFSAFMSIISNLMRKEREGSLEDKVYCIYISPLRALNNDVYKNLSKPLEELYASLDGEKKKISIGVRTGDTTQSERQKQLRKPPNILVTTPESLAILINSPRFLENLRAIEYVVVDEIHELANNKRGVHLSLSLERLADLIGKDFIRVGLGATLHPIDEAAKFLAGYKSATEERDCYIVDATWEKKTDLLTISPVKDIINASDEKIENQVYSKINRIIRKNKTTLIFTNTRSGTERVIFNLMRRFKYSEDSIAAHHGSLSREARLGVEDMLKKGKLKCAVSSTSLELGVDIGDIDNVIQLGSPKSVTRAIQRVGRSGHSFNDVAVGEIIVMNRDDLVECSIIFDSVKKRKLDSFFVPKNALDILCQHVVGMSLNKKWTVSDAIAVIRKAYPYHELSDSDFLAVLEYLSGMYVGLESRRVYGKIWYDEKEKTFGRRGKFTKIIYYLNLGSIPDTSAVDVYTTKGKEWLGSIEEEFLSRLKPDDIFVLGGKLYRFEYARAMVCFVSKAESRSPTIPPWFSEQLPLTYDLAISIGKFRGEFAKAVERDINKDKRFISLLSTGKTKPGKESSKILDAMPIDDNAKSSIFSYFAEQLIYAKYIPNDKFILIEKTRDKERKHHLTVFHSLYGRRINDALSRTLAILASEYLGIEVSMIINDNGFVLITEKEINSKDLSEMIGDLGNVDMESLLKDNIRRTELMKRKFRHCAARSFMILRNYKGRKISISRQQISSQSLLRASEEIGPNFPVIKETYREILEDTMDLPRAKEIARSLFSGEISHKIINTVVPSPFSHILVSFGEADVVMMKDRRKHLRDLHKKVILSIKKGAK